MKCKNRLRPDATSPTSCGVVIDATRRGLLKMSVGLFAVSTTPWARDCIRKVGGASCNRLMDAFDAYGQWAQSPTWGHDIHRSMGAVLIRIAQTMAYGPNAVSDATELALKRLALFKKPPGGAVVVTSTAPGPRHLRDAYSAYRAARDHLPAHAYCAYSPLAADLPSDIAMVTVSVAWR